MALPIPEKVLFLAPLGLGLMALNFGIRNLRYSLQSRTWPCVKGMVLSKVMDFGDESIYSPNITYEYSVNGKTYVSNQRHFSWTGSSFEAREIANVAEYKTGKEVTVYYCPQKPEVAILERGKHTAAIFMILAGVLFSTLSIIAIFTEHLPYGRSDL